MHFISHIRSDLAYDLVTRPVVLVSAIFSLAMMALSLLAPFIVSQNPFDPAQLDLLNSHLPPVGVEGGAWEFPLGTDKLGRDLMSAILYGLRISLFVGAGAVAISTSIGILVGIVAGYFGGRLDAILMRIAEIQFAFPPLLLALMLSGVLRTVIGPEDYSKIANIVLMLAIGLAGWVQYARVVRGSTMIERTKDYVLASRVSGYRSSYILRRHILPNVLGPVLVLAMTQLSVAIIYEATLSFLGLGSPPTTPSLGALIQAGSEYLFSGFWWVTVIPGLALLSILVALTIVGDWTRDALNPKVAP